MTGFLDSIIILLNFVVVPGLSYGAQLALGALGVTLVYGVLRFSNFAHGDLMAFGTAITIFVTWWLQSMGVHLGPLPTALLAMPVGIVGGVLLALATDRFVFRYYRISKTQPIVVVMASVGVMFIYNGITRLLIGPDYQQFDDGARFLISASQFRELTGLTEGLAIKTTTALTLVLALISVAWLFWFLYNTRTGKAMRAFSDNEDLAMLSGIMPSRIVTITWIIAASLAVIAGTLYGLDKSFRPFNYTQLLLPIFAAAIVGGIGHPVGAVVGGFLVAFSEIIVTYAFKSVAAHLGFEADGMLQFLSVDYKYAVSFLILVTVLLVRPNGIFQRGRK